MTETLCDQIKSIKDSHDMFKLEQILYKMRPLIRKYAKKLYFMEKDDACQELNIALIEAVYRIKKYDNEYMCISYLQKAVIYKYNYLCKNNFKLQLIDNNEEINENTPYFADYNTIEFYIDLGNLLKNKNYIQNCIVENLMNDLSDNEIARKIGVSRQYVNRIKKHILKELYL